MSVRRSHNQHLKALPTDDEILAAVSYLGTANRRYRAGVTAQQIAWKLGVQGASRLGNGAVKGSWSGKMAPALRIAPRLAAMERRGQLRGGYWGYDNDSHRKLWVPV